MQALISVYDKTGLDQICPILIDAGYKIISTGGTFEYLKKIGIKVDSVYSITGESEILNGRVKTLHPKIHAGILADTENDSHLKDLNNLNIDTFDIVINNLYPFEEVVARKNSTDAQIIENIDIGGPAMLRAAAKNYKRVTVLIDPKDYEMLAEKITKGGIDLPTRKILAKKVFQLVSKYDKSIENYLSNQSEENFKNRLDISYHKISDLRYGENPHQKGAIYSNVTKGIANSKLLNGKAMSYLNYLDADSAFMAVNSFPNHCVSIVKHTNSCGLSYSSNQLDSYKMALRGDPISAYGGIVGFNTELEENTALEMSSMFFDVIVAPSYTMKALKILNKKKNTRILTSNFQEEFFQFRSINGGLLYQEIDNKKDLIKNWDFVTKNKPNKNEIKNWAFAWECTKFVKSNAIIITSEKSIIGIGSGQPNRINSVNLAIEKAKSYLTENSILASDAFFPFSDSIELASKYNIQNIIQPGGSIRDHEVISEANRHNIKMIFTNTRHFSH